MPLGRSRKILAARSFLFLFVGMTCMTFVLNAPINEKHHIGARSARRESVNLKQASFHELESRCAE